MCYLFLNFLAKSVLFGLEPILFTLLFFCRCKMKGDFDASNEKAKKELFIFHLTCGMRSLILSLLIDLKIVNICLTYNILVRVININQNWSVKYHSFNLNLFVKSMQTLVQSLLHINYIIIHQ